MDHVEKSAFYQQGSSTQLESSLRIVSLDVGNLSRFEEYCSSNGILLEVVAQISNVKSSNSAAVNFSITSENYSFPAIFYANDDDSHPFPVIQAVLWYRLVGKLQVSPKGNVFNCFSLRPVVDEELKYFNVAVAQCARVLRSFHC